jgi:hypothetical protein
MWLWQTVYTEGFHHSTDRIYDRGTYLTDERCNSGNIT